MIRRLLRKKRRQMEDPFVCHVREELDEGSRKRWRRACKNLSFYGEHEDKHYCVLHYPAEKRKEDFERTIEVKLHEADYNFRGTVFPADTAQFAGYKFDGDVDFNDAIFYGEVNFQGTEFAGENAGFGHAKFAGGYIYFIDAKFRGNAHFASAKFEGEWTFFSEAVFEGEFTGFLEAEFDSQHTVFSHVKFSSTHDIDFQDAKFTGGDVLFVDAEFGGWRTFFSGAKFENDRTNFSGAKLLSSGVTKFSDAEFGGGSTFFRGSEFGSEETHFSSTVFSSVQTDFTAANFLSRSQRSKTIDFSGAQFRGENTYFVGALLDSELIQFSDATFIGTNTLFIGAKFSGQNLNFSRTDFSAHNLVFTGAKYGSKLTRFAKTKFNSEVTSFDNTAFSGADVLFDEARFKGKVTFLKTSKLLTFTGEEEVFGSRTWVQFDHCWIDEQELLTFSNVLLHPGWFINVDIRDVVFTDVKWYGMPGGPKGTIRREIYALKERNVESPHALLAQACRRLSANAEDQHEYPLANEFHYWSMEAQRKEGPFSKFAPWRLTWWYWALSGYSERPARAAIWLLFILVGFAGFYMLEGPEGVRKLSQAHVISSVWQSVVYSLGVMTRLRGTIPISEDASIRAAAILEGVLGPFQIALLALALRRKFMR